ncbi:MAG: glycosyltransferase family 2 protein [Kiritimatiellae bacterium]|nr:glycosyltransferase family 2 protein [Kiritimatiellia bacterium]
MLKDKRVVVVMPAYNAAETLLRTYEEVMAQGIVDSVVITDDASRDRTTEIARGLAKVKLHVHERNLGYGANQKTCYRAALDDGADIVVMVHPDYQYTPKLLPAMADMIASGLYACVLGSRILGGQALKGGMPCWKYLGNRLLTFVQNLLIGAKLSEYHTGYRAFAREVLERLPLDHNADGFVFDGQVLAEVVWLGYTIAEISCPTQYFPEASSIDFRNSLAYGTGCVLTALEFRLARMGLLKSARFPMPRREHA